jgi:hypothetical protein
MSNYTASRPARGPAGQRGRGALVEGDHGDEDDADGHDLLRDLKVVLEAGEERERLDLVAQLAEDEAADHGDLQEGAFNPWTAGTPPPASVSAAAHHALVPSDEERGVDAATAGEEGLQAACGACDAAAGGRARGAPHLVQEDERDGYSEVKGDGACHFG